MCTPPAKSFSWARLPYSTKLHVCRYLSLQTLGYLRQTSHEQKDLVRDALAATLEELVRMFLPDPRGFLQHLTARGGVIGGDVAVLFLLRTRLFRPHTLDVFLPAQAGPAVENELFLHQGAIESSLSVRNVADEPELAERGLHAVVTVRTTVGLGAIVLHSSASPDPLVPVSRSWCTTDVSYVNMKYFGTGYPRLLFIRRALLGDEVSYADALLDRAESRGFDVRLMPDQWAEWAGPDCGAARWICPTQPRKFNDRGAIFARLDPLVYSPMVVSNQWRMDCRPCGGNCLKDHSPWGMSSSDKFVKG
ncbi:hypothetical protein C8Q76DRAFT_605900 [Earliella scabrosa]|nr:hypothetical protein C8Q76DRAFT_605900 [Earliella scabrosa]